MTYKKITLTDVPDNLKNTNEFKSVVDAITQKGWLKPNKWELDDFVVYISEDGEFRRVADTDIVDYDLDY